MPPPYPDIKVPLRPREIEKALEDLAATYGALCQRTVFGTTTARGKQHSYIKIANGSGANRPAVLIIGGVHANEWAPPDALVTFARNLLGACPNVTQPSCRHDHRQDSRHTGMVSRANTCHLGHGPLSLLREEFLSWG